MRFLFAAAVLSLAPMALASEAAPKPAPAPKPAKRPDVADLVDVQRLIPDLVLDLRYATERNFIGKQVYPQSARCYLRRPVAERLARVADRLRKEDGTRLRVFDCYRPLSVQHQMWAVFPKPGYVANPKHGSVHNRGAAIDLTLAAPGGDALPMPTDFDTFDRRAWQNYRGGAPEVIHNRDRLRAAMRAEGFRTIRKEWWHYEAPDRKLYPVLDVPFEDLQTKE
ncbi:M15 family metallopeptidase [Vulgatibacter sp.]|uniref:M15 family metallopeptidase n=1 Tax=Vulgatibacter sp. TaxID=1971226 RepID=UPI003567B643